VYAGHADEGSSSHRLNIDGDRGADN